MQVYLVNYITSEIDKAQLIILIIFTQNLNHLKVNI
jgi:hypothetical protein